jgi:hypothetical protein
MDFVQVSTGIEGRMEHSQIREREGKVQKYRYDGSKIDLLNRSVHFFVLSHEVLEVLMHGEGSLLVSEDDGAHLILLTASMVSVSSHTVITKNDKSGLVIHLINDVVEDVFRIDDLSFNFRVLRVVSVASAINTDNVSKHEREVATTIKLFVNVTSNILIKGI